MSIEGLQDSYIADTRNLHAYQVYLQVKIKFMYRFVFVPLLWLFFLTPLCLFSQKDWQLKSEKEGIKIYTKYTDNSKYKAVKTMCTVQASLSTATAVLMDITNATEWVYATKSSTLLKTISPAELIYHSEINVPWPFDNRDFIVQLSAWQDVKTKTVTVQGENKPAYQPENKDVVRVPYSFSKWTLEPAGNGQINVVFELQTDPGGNIPAWLINMFATKGPFESFKKFKEQLKKTAYTKTVFPFIKE